MTSAGVAAATGPTIEASVKPDKPEAHSALKVTAKGPCSAAGLPTAVQIDVKKGFRAASTGGLEKLFNHLPNYAPPPGIIVTLKRLSLSAHAVRRAKRKTYPLITNPAKCSGDNWMWSSR